MRRNGCPAAQLVQQATPSSCSHTGTSRPASASTPAHRKPAKAAPITTKSTSSPAIVCALRYDERYRGRRSELSNSGIDIAVMLAVKPDERQYDPCRLSGRHLVTMAEL